MGARRRLPAALILIVFMVTASADTGVSTESRKEFYLFRAARDYAVHDYNRAEIEYRNVLRISPRDPVANRQLGIIYSEQGRLSKAFEYLQQATLLEPENNLIQENLGATFLAVGAYDEARGAAMRILGRQPSDEPGLLLLTDAARTEGEISEARQFIESLRQTDGDRAKYHLALGTLCLRQQDLFNAETEFKEALKLDPGSGAARFALGNIYWARNDFPQADQFLRMATELAPLRSPWRLRYADFLGRTRGAEAARRALAEITAKAPDYVPAWIELMNLTCSEKRDHDCSDIINTILAQDSVNYEARVARASLKIAEGKILEALIEFDQLRTLYYRVPDVHYRIALAELVTHNVDAAMRSLTEAIRLDPDFDDAILLRDDLDIAKGELAPAIASLTQIISRRPKRVQAHLLLADAYLLRKDSDQALTVYRQMEKFFPQDPQPPFLIGMLFARRNQSRDAQMAFEESLRIAPAYLPALEQLAGLYVAENRVAEAIKRVQAEIEKHPSNAGLWCLEAKIDMDAQDFPRAEKALLKAKDLDGNFETARLLLATSYAAQHKYQEALNELIRFAAKSNSPAAFMQIGLIQTELKQFAAARDAYESLLAVNPDFGPALNNLANIYSAQLSQPDKAYQLAERARRVLHDDPHVADTLGWIYFKKGLYHSAVSLLEQSAAKLPAEPELQFHLGMALEKVGRRDEAVLALQRAARTSTDFLDKEEAHRQLDQLVKKSLHAE